ncbi:hypothetical protein O6H91_04G092700 [Diphasiastrum complanatum]|uniref:Uncharacterized protein n=11 Tax=Diphasiastrum complanatum TaxID=34168 RepID=A0ACC2DZD1_DIPCM|nr:hypothetical protein O6H91_04G092700 [Diphasiastrum complanatum]KAJ7559596.1 hypothetical protein O6H91_04G092700 [Diphasiastrum complanatum]KAJ7559597.1 hypothetical protein O6H91_04G092700 [Diphasiastrum complanatum]KAJ7559598.1 hypothetical protein O6H91_04G092700 [Diphasiastrum complanatum]KAJ7559599.1 hypothetical protein O6H91_04G092700 [Diphasiastrum complanatum]
MENTSDSALFTNDGSFLERFKQLQQEQPASDSSKIDSPVAVSSPNAKKGSISIKRNTTVTSGVKGALSKPSAPSNGKLAFSLKPKSKPPAPAVKLSGDDEDEVENEKKELDRHAKKQRLEKVSVPTCPSTEHKSAAMPLPAPVDPEVKKVADKLASFVAKNGRQFENITRQKNPGDTPFRFLFDVNCADYKYYEYRLSQEQVAISADARHLEDGVSTAPSRQQSGYQKSTSQVTNYQTPASALYASGNEDQYLGRHDLVHSAGSSHLFSADSLAMMEFYMNKAAREDLHKPPRQAKDEMPPPPSLQAPAPSQKKGHHMGDYIPPEEMEKFLAKCNDAMANKYTKEAAEKAKIQADNVGHRLLSKMGWKEGEGLGSGKSGRSDPVQAGAVKLNNLGVGAEQPGEVTPEDDIYEQYKKRMMLGYRFRPNPLNNPRKAYY